MLALTFEEFSIRFSIDKKPMSIIKIEDIGKDISPTPIEIAMRDQTPDSIDETNFIIIVNLQPSDGTHWVLVVRRDGEKIHYFDSFGVKTSSLFLKENVDLGSHEKIPKM